MKFENVMDFRAKQIGSLRDWGWAIAAELLAHPEQTLAAVHRTDDDVGTDVLKEPLERRTKHTVPHSDRRPAGEGRTQTFHGSPEQVRR